jgi:hypothetical protein
VTRCRTCGGELRVLGRTVREDLTVLLMLNCDEGHITKQVLDECEGQLTLDLPT